ncbi:MAG: hypothetical protein HYW10_03750, partial [Candidatus Omnitrophica bacterium]|nr:hypothetical protein [Candidatus Omnitrophota bacterium]
MGVDQLSHLPAWLFQLACSTVILLVEPHGQSPWGLETPHCVGRHPAHPLDETTRAHG